MFIFLFVLYIFICIIYMSSSMTLWIPNDMGPDSQTMDIASTMINDFGVSKIDNDAYNNNFNEYYDQHIRKNESKNRTFCSSNGNGINVEYLILNANKKTYVTLLSLEIDPNNPDNIDVLAMMVFKWSPTASSVKIQAFCSNQKRLVAKGSGTKLMNFLKKTLTHMGINNIYLNPIPNAVSYYKSQQFKEAKTPGKKIHDSSSPKPKSKSKSSSKSKSASKPKSASKKMSASKPKSASKKMSASKPKSSSKHQTSKKSDKMPTMTINLRATKNWKTAKSKMKSYQTLTRKSHGKTYLIKEQKQLLEKVDKIVDDLSQDEREIVLAGDIIEVLDMKGIILNDEEKRTVERHLADKYNIYNMY